ncbi:MAG: triose-phosphate isomerase [Christensenella sp.]|uniref:triose-phosphate isomerase n=1 Tax=Christensenella sp. TaxID=1935934 RepID=UPI002B1E973B|nr:triose-phosphate isomerase [Christensenella sp.]MEA5004160.1 triose-phosphate isomerase [Christensenella sp.]
MRKPIIAGNWKMNMTPSETVKLIRELKPLVEGTNTEVVVCPMAVSLFAAKEALAGSNIRLGAQNVYFEDAGAYTGEWNCDSLLELGVEYVIIGHSERRQYFNESDETVNKKVHKALQKGLKPIVCVGEQLEQKQKGVTAEVVRMQTKLALEGVRASDIESIVIAYEPVWAIGTGMTATSAEANMTIREIRQAVRERYADAADVVRIQYGGSMNAKNAAELMAMSDIDGGLIGGASLKAEDFSKVVNY